MSILRSKHSGWTWEGRRTPFGGDGGGGGGSPAPTQTTSYNTNIPEYAKPYVTGMLEATQKQIYTDDRTGFRPYTPYSSDVQNYFAGFSPLQQQAQYEAARMQQPGQFALGSGLAGASGIGSALSGQQYAQQATTPGSIQAYMSPYMQNVVDYQKSQALRDYQMAAPMRARQAIGAGAFGGSRQAIESAEAQRNLMSQLQGIEATGRQSAFGQAQQAQQFGAQLGLQGLGQAGQMAGMLGQLGSQQQAADIARQNQMATMGKQQQELEQSKINQAIQNYAIQQQYPMMQLGFLSNMLRGLPLQSQTTQLYQAQPSTTQQALGLVGAGASLFGGRAGGGAIKEYREGGIASAVPGYKYGTLISEPKLDAMADRLSIPQLQERLRDPQLTTEERRIFQEALQEKLQEQARGTEARMAGIALGGGPAFEQQGLAGGGIVAFAGEDGSLISEPDDRMTKEEFEALVSRGRMPTRGYAPVEQPAFSFPKSFSEISSKKEIGKKYTAEQLDEIARGQGVFPEGSPALPGMPPVSETAAKKEDKKEEKQTGTKGTAAAQTAEDKAAAKGPSTFAQFLAERKAAGPKGEVGADFEKYLSERLGTSADRLGRDERMAMAKGFLKFASTPAPGGIMQAAAAGLGEYATGVEAARKEQSKMEMEAQKARMELDTARRAEARGDVAGAQEAYDKYQDRINRIQASQITAGAAGATQRYMEQQIQKVMAENPGMTYTEAMTRVAGAGRMESVDVQRAKAGLESINNALLFMKKDDPRRAELEAQRQKIIEYLTPGGGIGGGQAPSAGGAPQGVTVKKVG